MRVLIVEDDRFYAQRVSELLEDQGLIVATAFTVEQAVNIDINGFDAAIVDVMLPNNPAESGLSDEVTRSGFLSGIALCRHFRSKGVKVPLVLFSAFGMESEAHAWAVSNHIPYVCKEDGPHILLRALEVAGLKIAAQSPKAFIVHGHDEVALLELKNFLQNSLGWQEPMILRERPSKGKTIIEKFEDLTSRIDFVFVLLTPDDPGLKLTTEDDKRRARQNVIFELGFFYALLGRRNGNVIVLKKGSLDIPSDTQGIVWIDITNGISAASEEIRREVSLSKSF